jgi:hypothetical protein
MTLTTIEDISKIVAFGGDDPDDLGTNEPEEEKELGLEDDDEKDPEEDPEKKLEEELDEDDVEEE